jgi:murein DD-endopeptidase MepM/ murein hydrolase activator NlpD
MTVLSICCFLLVVSGILGAFFWYGASYTNTMYAMASKDSSLKNTQASLDELRDEIALLLREWRNFENALLPTLSALGVDVSNNSSQNVSGDLGSILDIVETPEGLLREVYDIQQLWHAVLSFVEPVKEIRPLLESQSALLTEIPSIWPIKDGKGHISMFFGQNINPFTGQYYIHKGIDLSTYRAGDPIVATADGQVVTAEYAYDFGNYIIIRHKHGYYTRYAHMLSFRVRIGQRVQQNEVIGYIGNTGISTGPHLHYEVHIGSDVVDPYKYINIRSSIAKQGR